jgi:ParB family transcriptional regulator, chromosome partitioning protein
MNDEIKLIPIDRIRILNPRHRDRKKFEPILESIKNLGLKKPIQVSLRARGENGEAGYDLVCGQGRLEAFVALGHKEIPAIVVEVSPDERLLRSLVENIARRQPSPLELIREIERLRGLGHSIQAVAAKLDVSENTVNGLTALKRAGERRLLEAALEGTVPLWVAIDIAKADTPETQRELLKAFEAKQLNRVSIRVVKRLIDQRRFLGRQNNRGDRNLHKSQNTAERLVKVFKRESQRQKRLVQKAKVCETKLLFLTTAFSQLLADDRFRMLLRTQGLDALPQYLLSKLDHQPTEV